MSLAVDRTTFLTLAFGMAGVSCNTGPGPAVAANVVEIPAQPQGTAADGGAAIATSPERPRPDEPKLRATAEPEPDDDSDDDLGMPAGEGGVAIVTAQDASCGYVDPKKVSRPTAACAEDQGTAGSCNVMKTCPGFPFPKQQCEDFRRHMKPKVAQRALDCLSKLTAKQVCDACTTYKCGDLALKTSCPDPAVDAPCAQITAKCSSVSMVDCKMYMAGLNAAGRAKLTSCITSKSGCGFGIYSCVESL